MSIKEVIFILLLIFINTADYPEYNTQLKCGKENPKEAEDCTPYGTGSGLLCCWVSESKTSKVGDCYLYPHNIKEKFGVSGEKTFDISGTKTNTNNFWSCGNKSSYMNINLIMILLALFSL